jgi:hypothetical protein
MRTRSCAHFRNARAFTLYFAFRVNDPEVVAELAAGGIGAREPFTGAIACR